MTDTVTAQIGLNFSDLKLLMDTYQNMIQLNTILLEQQKRVIELQQSIIKKEETNSIKQEQIYVKIDDVGKNMFSCIKNLEEINKSMKISHDDLYKKVCEEFKESSSTLTSVKVENIQQSSSIKNKIYIAFVGMGIIIITLLGVLFN